MNSKLPDSVNTVVSPITIQHAKSLDIWNQLKTIADSADSEWHPSDKLIVNWLFSPNGYFGVKNNKPIEHVNDVDRVISAFKEYVGPVF